MKSTRRNFLRNISTASLAAVAIPAFASQQKIEKPFGVPDESYWQKVKSSFPIGNGLTMMNAANLCPSPNAILDKVAEFQKGLSGDVSMQFRARFPQMRKTSIGMLASFIGAQPEEVGITRNTSESNCTVIHGLDFKAGDEVILWDQNHPSNKEIWQKQALRTGIVIKLVTLPADVSSEKQILDTFTSAFTSKTKFISFSHISNVSGIALPAKDICTFARSKNVLSLVDGAQTLGFHEVNVKDLGCDFYTASTHKWLMGPLENGILFMRNEHIEKIWPNIIGGGWHDNTNTVDDKICFLGQRNDPTAAAIPEAIRFHETIGRKYVYDRVIELNTFLKEKLKTNLPKAQIATPLSPSISGGIVVLTFPGKDSKIIVEKLYNDHGIAGAFVNAIRLSPHVYNTKTEIISVIEALGKITA